MSIEYTRWLGYGARVVDLGPFKDGDDPKSDLELAARMHGCTLRSAGNSWSGTDNGSYLMAAGSVRDIPQDTAVRLVADRGELIVAVVRCANALGIVIDDPGWYVGGRVF